MRRAVLRQRRLLRVGLEQLFHQQGPARRDRRQKLVEAQAGIAVTTVVHMGEQLQHGFVVRRRFVLGEIDCSVVVIIHV